MLHIWYIERFILKTNKNLKRREFFCLRENNKISAQLIFTGENINMDRRVGMERELAKRVLMHEEKGKEGVNKRTKPRLIFFLALGSNLSWDQKGI